MNRKILPIAVLSLFILTSCKDKPKNVNANKHGLTTTDHVITDRDGKILEMLYHEKDDSLTVKFEGGIIGMKGQRPASGIWYKNDHYELRGKGDEVTLTKDCMVVFSNEDEIFQRTSTDKSGNDLTMSFNMTKNIVTVNFGEKSIELKGAGIMYKNEQYELRGTGNDFELTENGKVIFSHKDDIETISVTDKKGRTLEILFNKTTDEASTTFNGELINMRRHKTDSGALYRNNFYELSRNGAKVELKQHGQIAFEN